MAVNSEMSSEDQGQQEKHISFCPYSQFSTKLTKTKLLPVQHCACNASVKRHAEITRAAMVAAHEATMSELIFAFGGLCVGGLTAL